MKLNAYILAADPAWIEASVLSYYEIVNKIIVSYDEDGSGWTGTPIAVPECLERLRAIDRDKKMQFVPGHYARTDHTPMENDTYQRQCALDAAGHDADWVLQFDTDEFLPNPDALVKTLGLAQTRGDLDGVEWPMRVLFRRLHDGRYLEICARDGQERFEYPGSVAARPSARLMDARRVAGRFLRPVVRGDNRSLQLLQPVAPAEERLELLGSVDAVLHNSWARPAESIRSKISSWSHNDGYKSWLYYYLQWKPSSFMWWALRDFHPFARGLWPALKPCSSIPPECQARLKEAY
jgi:hypothetical protein